MVGWHHGLSGDEFEQALVVGDGQGGLACCSPWGRKESDKTEQFNNKKAVLVTLWGYITIMLCIIFPASCRACVHLGDSRDNS